MFCAQYKHTIAQQQAQLTAQQALIASLDRVSAIIEFDLSGHILTANANFLQAVGFTMAELQGKHHQIFMVGDEAQSAGYKQFWQALNRGEFVQGRFRRRKKNGEILWLEASYNPVLNAQGQPYKVIKFATDVTQSVKDELYYKAQIAAINQVMAVIEFDPQGTILHANSHFLNAVGYSLEQIVGKHHSLFVGSAYANSTTYKQFWIDLAQGKYKSGTFQRFGAQQKEIWLEASYNPIKDCDDKVIKVIKFATDIGSNPNAQLLDAVIKDASNVVGHIAQGDLTLSMQNHLNPSEPTLYDKNIGQLSQAILDMSQRLASVIGVSVKAASSVHHSAQEVKDGSYHLNQAIQEQAAALLDTSANMKQLNQVIQTNTQRAQQAAEVANNAQQKSGESVQVMQQTIAAMNQIQESSHKIADIVSLIDGIAFQTNLLALNAAVEAARAGEHGRGFAVVAGEVRNLAQKSAEAAKDIKRLIDETVARVNQGSGLATQSGEVLQGITSSIGTITDMITQIAQASIDQAHGIVQVDHALAQIDAVSQQNAALVEQTSAAAESMGEQASILREDMAFFKLNAHNPRLLGR